MSKTTGVKRLPTLVRQVKMVYSKKAFNEKQIVSLSQSIFKSLKNTQNEYRKKIYLSNYKKIRQLFEKFIAEEEILISLLVILQDKFTRCIAHNRYKSK